MRLLVVVLLLSSCGPDSPPPMKRGGRHIVAPIIDGYHCVVDATTMKTVCTPLKP